MDPTSLAQELPTITLLPGSASYEAENVDHWHSGCILKPGCIITPTSAQELATALKIIVREKIPFAIRSGGRNGNVGWSSVDNGVVLSLSKLNTVSFDQESKIALIGAGARWHEVYSALRPYKVTVAGGNNGAPSVSGLLLGGGVGPYYNKVGYSSDAVINYEVVLANGDIVNANATTHPSLHWALKAGGTNFGIVTRVDMATIPQDRVWAGIKVIAGPENYNHALSAMKGWLKGGLEDEKASVQFGFPGPEKMIISMFYDDDAETVPTALEPFAKLPGAVMDTLKLTTFEQVAKASLTAAANGSRHYCTTLTTENDADLLLEIAGTFNSAATEIKDVAGFAAMNGALPLGKIWLQKTHEAGGPAVFPDIQKTYVYFLFITTWSSAEDDEKVMEWTRKIMKRLNTIAEEKGMASSFLFMNNCGEEQDPFAGYRKENVDKLKDVSREYDSERVFQKLLNGGFKLGL